jgi:hypothetical protein
MVKKCELLVTEKVGQVMAGTISLDTKTGKLSVQPKKGYEQLFENALDEDHVVDGENVSKDVDVGAWLDSLPQHYNGSYLRARIL